MRFWTYLHAKLVKKRVFFSLKNHKIQKGSQEPLFDHFLVSFWDLLGSLGDPWVSLGTLLDSHGGPLGTSWGLLGLLGTLLGPSWANFKVFG